MLSLPPEPPLLTDELHRQVTRHKNTLCLRLCRLWNQLDAGSNMQLVVDQPTAIHPSRRDQTRCRYS
jgi:hypothetical protein